MRSRRGHNNTKREGCRCIYPSWTSALEVWSLLLKEWQCCCRMTKKHARESQSYDLPNRKESSLASIINSQGALRNNDLRRSKRNQFRTSSSDLEERRHFRLYARAGKGYVYPQCPVRELRWDPMVCGVNPAKI
jgi:hypothetical protein